MYNDWVARYAKQVKNNVLFSRSKSLKQGNIVLPIFIVALYT